MRQRAPTAVHRIAAVADGVVAPVGLAVAFVEVGTGAVIGIVSAIIGVGAPRLIAHGPMVVAARAPAEEVAVNSLALAALSIVTKIIPLVLREFPVRRGGTADVLQVAFGEVDLLRGTHRELAIDGAFGSGRSGGNQFHANAFSFVIIGCNRRHGESTFRGIALG